MNVLRLLIAGVLCASAGVSAAADLRLGYVSTERVYREAKEAVTAQKRLESEFSAREKDLAAIAKRARDIQTQLETGKLSDGERKQKERDLLAIDRDAAGAGVQRHRAAAQHRRGLAARATDQRAQTGDQFLRLERLRAPRRRRPVSIAVWPKCNCNPCARRIPTAFRP